MVWAPGVRIVLVFVICMFLTGCWDAKEIDQLAIATASGLDYQKDSPQPVRGYLQIAIPSALGTTSSGSSASDTGTTKTFVVVDGEGRNLIEALNSARQKLSRVLVLSHRRVMIVGEDYARHGVGDVIDEVIRNPSSRLRTILLVSYHEPASAIMELPYPLERLPQEAVLGLTQTSTRHDFTVKDFVTSMEHGDPFTLGIEPQQFGATDKDSGFALTHVAVFRDEKLVGWLGDDDMEGFLWLKGILRSNLATVHVPQHPGFVDLTLLRSKTVRTVTWVHGRPQVFVKVEIQDDIVHNGTDLNVSDPRDIQLIQSALSTQIQARMNGTLEKLQHQYRSDPINITNEIYKSSPSWWHSVEHNWRQAYSQVPVRVHVEVNIRRTGYITQTVKEDNG